MDMIGSGGGRRIVEIALVLHDILADLGPKSAEKRLRLDEKVAGVLHLGEWEMI